MFCSMHRYVAKLAGLYPEDPIVAAYADQASFLLYETFDVSYQGSKNRVTRRRCALRICSSMPCFRLSVPCQGSRP